MANNQQDITFVFEVCAQCATHQWNTRHDEGKYAGIFNEVSAAIKAQVPNAICVMNRVPKPWFEKEVYCQLIPNEDDNNPYYDILPRIGAFEVSTVHDNVDILFYSKMMSTMWPHPSSLATRIKAYCDEAGGTAVAGLKEKFQTSGRQVRQPRRRGSQGSVAGMNDTGRSQPGMNETGKSQEPPAAQMQQEQQADVVDHKEQQPVSEEDYKQEDEQEPVVEEVKKEKKEKKEKVAKAEPADAETAQEPVKQQPTQEAAPAQEAAAAETAKEQEEPAQEESQPAAATQ